MPAGKPRPHGVSQVSSASEGFHSAQSAWNRLRGSTASIRWPGLRWSSRLPEISPYVGKEAASKKTDPSGTAYACPFSISLAIISIIRSIVSLARGECSGGRMFSAEVSATKASS